MSQLASVNIEPSVGMFNFYAVLPSIGSCVLH